MGQILQSGRPLGIENTQPIGSEFSQIRFESNIRWGK